MLMIFINKQRNNQTIINYHDYSSLPNAKLICDKKKQCQCGKISEILKNYIHTIFYEILIPFKSDATFHIKKPMTYSYKLYFKTVIYMMKNK